MKWTYVMPAALVLSVVGLATACGSDDKKSTPPTVDSFCAKVAAACPNQGTAADCKTGLSAFQSACPTETDDLIQCGSSAQVTCGATPTDNTFTGCDDQLLALVTCVLGGFGGAPNGGAGGMSAGGTPAGGSSSGGAGGG